MTAGETSWNQSPFTGDIRRDLQSLVKRLSKNGDHTTSDVWRALQSEAAVLSVQDRVESAIDSRTLKLQVKILDHHSTTTRHGYSFQSATVNVRQQESAASLRLAFRYERQSIHEAYDVTAGRRNNPTVSYTVDFLDGRLDNETLAVKLLWVQVWAANPSRPSSETKLIEVMHPDELSVSNDHEDFDHEKGSSLQIGEELAQGDVEVEEPPQKKARTSSESNNSEGSEYTDTLDHFLAGVDNDLLERMRQTLSLTMNDADACQFLLKFPFAENEWDLEGMLFDALFDYDGEGRCGV